MVHASTPNTVRIDRFVLRRSARPELLEAIATNQLIRSLAGYNRDSILEGRLDDEQVEIARAMAEAIDEPSR